MENPINDESSGIVLAISISERRGIKEKDVGG